MSDAEHSPTPPPEVCVIGETQAVVDDVPSTLTTASDRDPPPPPSRSRIVSILTVPADPLLLGYSRSPRSARVKLEMVRKALALLKQQCPKVSVVHRDATPPPPPPPPPVNVRVTDDVCVLLSSDFEMEIEKTCDDMSPLVFSDDKEEDGDSIITISDEEEEAAAAPAAPAAGGDADAAVLTPSPPPPPPSPQLSTIEISDSDSPTSTPSSTRRKRSTARNAHDGAFPGTSSRRSRSPAAVADQESSDSTTSGESPVLARKKPGTVSRSQEFSPYMDRLLMRHALEASIPPNQLRSWESLVSGKHSNVFADFTRQQLRRRLVELAKGKHSPGFGAEHRHTLERVRELCRDLKLRY